MRPSQSTSGRASKISIAKATLWYSQFERIHPIQCQANPCNPQDYPLGSSIPCLPTITDGLPGCSDGADSIDSVEVPVPCQFNVGEDVINFYAMDEVSCERRKLLMGEQHFHSSSPLFH